MPAKSKAQRAAAGAALAAKRGSGVKLTGAAKQMAAAMSERQLREFAAKPKGKRR